MSSTVNSLGLVIACEDTTRIYEKTQDLKGNNSVSSNEGILFEPSVLASSIGKHPLCKDQCLPMLIRASGRRFSMKISRLLDSHISDPAASCISHRVVPNFDNH